MEDDTIFKKCPLCLHCWKTRKEFLDDRTLKLNGYQADFEEIDDGLFFFTHQVEDCFSTMAVMSVDFHDMYTGIKYPKRKTGSDECPGHCLKKDQFDRCDAECEYAFVREILHLIREHQDG
jgi:hypothetical protein